MQNLALMPMGVHYALINLGEWKVTGCELRYRSEAATKGGQAPLPAPVSDDEGRARQSPTPPFEGRGSHCRRSLTSLTPSAAAGVSRSELSEDFGQDLDVRVGFYKIRTSANDG